MQRSGVLRRFPDARGASNLRYSCQRVPKRRRPGQDFAVNPGPSVRCVREAAPRLFYARAARHSNATGIRRR